NKRDCPHGVRLRRNEARCDAQNGWRYSAMTLKRAQLGGTDWNQISKMYQFKPGGNKMPRFCASCGSLVAEGALACTSCGATVGQSVGGGAAPATATTGLTEN